MKVARGDGESERKREREIVDAGDCLDDAGDCEMMVYINRLDRRVQRGFFCAMLRTHSWGKRQPPAAPLNAPSNSLPPLQKSIFFSSTRIQFTKFSSERDLTM